MSPAIKDKSRNAENDEDEDDRDRPKGDIRLGQVQCAVNHARGVGADSEAAFPPA